MRETKQIYYINYFREWKEMIDISKPFKFRKGNL